MFQSILPYAYNYVLFHRFFLWVLYYFSINNFKIHKIAFDIYFWLRFGRKFLTFNAYYFNSSYQIWVRFIFVYQKSLKRTLKLVFEYKITFWICVLVMWIHWGYCVVKKLVWNVRIKSLLYPKNIKIYKDFYLYHFIFEKIFLRISLL